MATMEVKVPDIGDFADVPVISVMVKPGDRIAKEDPLIELESDKATLEVPSPAEGEVKEVRVSEGDKVSEGSLVLILELANGKAGGNGKAEPARAGEGDASRPAEGGASQAAQEADRADETVSGQQEMPERETPKGGDGASGAGGVGGVTGVGGPAGYGDTGRRDGAIASIDQGFRTAHASPSVRAFARELGVDLGQVKGSGRKGRILREDVVAFYKSQSAPATAAAPAAQGGADIPPIPKVDFSKFGPVEDVEMPRIKKISGPALHRSWLNVPHVTHNEEADITEIDAYRKELDTAAKAEGYRVTLLAFLVKASVAALKAHWEVNSSIHPDGDKLIRKNFWNIGFAADTPQGLVVPVIKGADGKGIIEISKELGELSGKARKGELKSGDMQGATFTISSLGGIGGVSFTPLVNAPEVAILGVTRARMAPVWNGTEFQPRLMLPMSLSYDHRAIDGALGARFCATLAHLLGDVRRLVL